MGRTPNEIENGKEPTGAEIAAFDRLGSSEYRIAAGLWRA